MKSRGRPTAGSSLAGHTGTDVRVEGISTGNLPLSDRGNAWSGFLDRWIVPGDVEFASSAGDRKCSALAMTREHGCTVMFGDAAPQRLVHAARHLGNRAPRAFALYVFAGGSGEIQQEGSRVPFAAGDVLLRDAGGASVLASETGFRASVTLVPVDHLGPVILQRFGRSPFVMPENAPGRLALIDLLRGAEAKPQQLAAENFRHFEAAVTGVLRYAGVAAFSPMQGDAGNGDKIVPDLLEIINRSIRDPDFTLATLAARTGKSERWIRHLLTAEGIRFKQYIIRHRLELARRALIDPAYRGRSILSIALDCGFNDQTQFNRSFARHFGMPPGRFRREVAHADRNNH
jgi:AraC-like DNA-binding protein